MDTSIRYAESHLFRGKLREFIRPTGNSTYRIHDRPEIKLLKRLRVGFSHLPEHNFRYHFAEPFM